MPGTVAGAWDTVVNKRAKTPWPHGANILVWESTINIIASAGAKYKGENRPITTESSFCWGGSGVSLLYFIIVIPEQSDGGNRFCSHSGMDLR